MASQQLLKEEEKQIKEIFDSIDTKKNGHITKEELIKCYMSMDANEKVANEEVHKIMTRADVNQNGVIDYNEFMMASLSTENALSNERLKKAFDFFDLVYFYYIHRIKMEQ